MAWTTQLDSLVQQSVVAFTLSGIDGYGDPSYSTAGTTYPARITWQPHRVTDYAGNDRVAYATLIVATTDDIPVTTKLVLPNGESPSILSIRQVPWIDGTDHHYAISVGGLHERNVGGWGG